MALCTLALSASTTMADTSLDTSLANPIASHLQDAEQWVAQVNSNLNPSPVNNDTGSNLPIDNMALVNKAFDGKFGASAYEGLRTISTYLGVLELKVRTSNQQIDKRELVSSIDDLRKRVDKVIDSFGDFIDARQHSPKNPKDEVKYTAELEKRAAKVLLTTIDQLDVRRSQNLLLENRLNPLITTDSRL
jgi:hypothetical protein